MEEEEKEKFVQEDVIKINVYRIKWKKRNREGKMAEGRKVRSMICR